MAKKKSLMDALSDYQGEHGYGPKAKGAVKGKGPVRDGGTYGKLLKKNKEEDKGGPKGVLAPKKRTTSSSSSSSSSSRSGGTDKPKSTPSRTTSSSSSSSKGKLMPSNPQYKNITMKARKKRPGTGRTGEAAAKAANREGPKPKNEHKESKRKVNRRGRRVR